MIPKKSLPSPHRELEREGGGVSYFPGVLTPGNLKDPVSLSFTIKRLGSNINPYILYFETAEELGGFFGCFRPW